MFDWQYYKCKNLGVGWGDEIEQQREWEQGRFDSTHHRQISLGIAQTPMVISMQAS